MTCHKVSYSNEQSALMAKRMVEKRRGILLHAYQCGNCKFWHLGNTKGTRKVNLDRAFNRMHQREGWNP